MKKMQAMLVLLLCAALVLMGACGGTGAPSAPDEPSGPASQGNPGAEIPPGEGETPAALPETLPEDTTELTVPLQVVEPGTEGIFSSGEWSYSTQADADVCRRWLYDLKAGDITALYGEISPLDHYWNGEMKMEDSRRVVQLLRSMAPGLVPMEAGNPATGGGWTVAVRVGDEAADFGFDGYWFTFTYQGTIWILDGTDPASLESGYEIQTILWNYGYYGRSPSESVPDPIEPPPPTETYFDDNIQAIYAVDRENYVMAQVKDGYFTSRDIWEGLENRASVGGEPSGYGYFILTDEGREYVYLNDSEEDQTLNKLCKSALNNGPLHPSWLIHMTPERMVEAVTGAGKTTDKGELLALAKFLKEEVTVRPKATIHDGNDNPDTVSTLIDWWITFDSGVRYTLIGYGGENYLSLYASDLNKVIAYDLDEGVDWRMLDYEGWDWPE